MSLYDGPPRGGSRGGQDQFSWEGIKADKDRECYLGHSLKAPVGRWQKGRDLTWYSKGAKGSADLALQLKAERDAVKQQEADAMAIALGLKKGTIQKPKEALSKQDVAEATRRGSEEGGPEPEADRPKGVGFGSRRISLASPVAESSTLPGTTPRDQPEDVVPKTSGSREAQQLSTSEDPAPSKKSKKDRKRGHSRRDSEDEREPSSHHKKKKAKKEKKHKHKHRHRTSERKK